MASKSSATASHLRNQQRRAARIALYSSLIVSTLAAAALFPLIRRTLESDIDTSWTSVDFESLPEVQRLQELLRIDTTPESGGEALAADYLAGELRAAGIETTIERLAGGRANLWASIEGRQREALVLHNHLDTDPIAQPDEWVNPPFGGNTDGLWIYGRGAFDMKSVAIAQLEAMLSLQAETERTGRQPERSVLFLATSSEETGSDLGVRHLLANYPELVGRIWAVWTEGGVLEATDLDQIKYWGTSFTQKQYFDLWACSPSLERLQEMFKDIRRRGQVGRPRLTAEAKIFAENYGPTRDEVTFRRLLAEPETVVWDQWSLAILPPVIQAIFRDEIHPFPPEENPGGGYRMRITIHVLPGGDYEVARHELLPDWLTHGVALSQVRSPVTSHGSPIDHPAFTTLQELLRQRYRTEAVGPYFLSFYANDCRYFRGVGKPCYGFTPFLALTTDSVSITGPDERLALPAFVDGVELYRESVSRVAWAAIP